jgi:hypothetical protein
VMIILTAFQGCSRTSGLPAVAGARGGVVSELRAAFAKVNPAATRVWILDAGTRPAGSGHPDAGDEYAVVATAYQPGSEPLVDGKFSGVGQLFGIFVVDSTFSHVERVLKIFPTRRWGDYRVYLGNVDPDSITVLGEGETYGDEPLGFRCNWNGGAPREFARAPQNASEEQ